MIASIGCRADTVATPERQPDTTIRAKSVITPIGADFGASRIPPIANIRRDLDLAIARDADLKNRLISFIVANGDVSVTGMVRTEQERRKINDLAMNIGGVKSVANALLVAE